MNSLLSRTSAGALVAVAVATANIVPANAAPTLVGLREISQASPTSAPCPDNSRSATSVPIKACDIDGTAVFHLNPAIFVGTAISAQSHRNAKTGGWSTTVVFSPESSAQLRDATSRNVGKELAFVSGGRVVSFSEVREPITNGSLVISSASMSQQRAQQIARALGGS